MDFKKDLKTGKKGEQAFWDYCQSQKWVRSIIDLRLDKRAQRYDIDFAVETTERQFFFFEVKTDTQIADTGNIYYEYTSCGNSGCLEHSMADRIAYYCDEKSLFYIINLKRLRQFIKEHGITPLRAKNAYTTGYPIPIVLLLNEGIAHEQIL